MKFAKTWSMWTRLKITSNYCALAKMFGQNICIQRRTLIELECLCSPLTDKALTVGKWAVVAGPSACSKCPRPQLKLSCESFMSVDLLSFRDRARTRTIPNRLALLLAQKRQGCRPCHLQAKNHRGKMHQRCKMCQRQQRHKMNQWHQGR